MNEHMHVSEGCGVDEPDPSTPACPANASPHGGPAESASAKQALASLHISSDPNVSDGLRNDVPDPAEGNNPKADVPSTKEQPPITAIYDVQVVIGTSTLAEQDSNILRTIAEFSKFSPGEVRSRLAMGDAEPSANRVLHVAFHNGKVLGCCSSTISVPWGAGGAHWGALAVHPAAQGRGVGSALIAAAEGRLLERGCRRVQIEYHYYPGDPESERLRAWYENKLGFAGSGRGWRCASKKLCESTAAKFVPKQIAICGDDAKARSCSVGDSQAADPVVVTLAKTVRCGCSLM